VASAWRTRPACGRDGSSVMTSHVVRALRRWRITCFFVDRDHRRSGVAREALDGALELIAQAGGGEVVSFPNELAPGKRTSWSFLHNGTRAMFEQAVFTFERHIGKSKTVMRKTVPPARG